MESPRPAAPARTPGPHARDARRNTVLLLIRHAHTEAVGVYLAGRTHDVRLSPHGRAQAARLARALRSSSLDAIYSSPLARAMDTARAIAAGRHLRVRAADDLNEVDFGEWSGRTFVDLEAKPEWRTYNAARSWAPVPRGEDAAALTARTIAALARIHAAHPGKTVAVVSHAELIRAAVLHWRGLSWSRYWEVEIAPASVTTVVFGEGRAEIEIEGADHVAR
jgi:broad specificity phosphatase PhoE